MLNVLIIGGGVGGMTAAISLKRLGAMVTLIDADPEWRVYGAGISLTGLSLRAFDQLGVLDEIRQRGFVGAGARAKNVAGDLIFSAPVPDNPPPIACSGGIMRPVLHDILSSTVRREGITVRLGVKVRALTQADESVAVEFDDHTFGKFDLVVGADGINSWVRDTIFPNAPRPKFTGQGCWRVVAPRPADVDRTEMYFGGPMKGGVTPVSQDSLYLFLLEHAPTNPRYEASDLLPRLKQLLAPFGGNIATVREGLSAQSAINYRPLEWVLMPNPWYVGRIVLLGDAAHATTPHMASGAGVAAEDGIVLAQEIARNRDVSQALAAFMSRRFERARLVVENSVKIGEAEMAGAAGEETGMMIGRTMQELTAPF